MEALARTFPPRQERTYLRLKIHSTPGQPSRANAPCSAQMGSANPTCSSATANSYSLQLNTQPFATSTCSASPNKTQCAGWQQFVYSPSAGGSIQYWLLEYGPAGTACPVARSAHCEPFSESDGWCPVSFSPGSDVYCVVNAAASAPAPAEPITSLPGLSVTGAVAGVNGANDSIAVTTDNTVNQAPGNNYFPDPGSQWQEAEFNVFGDGNADQAVFNTGAMVVVRTALDSGTTSPPPVTSNPIPGSLTT